VPIDFTRIVDPGNDIMTSGHSRPNMDQRQTFILYDCNDDEIIPKVSHYHGCLGGAAVRCRTRDRKVAGSTPGRGTIKSTR